MAAVARSAPFSLSVAPTERELLAKYFRVLADPVRLAVLEALADEGDLSVGALVERVGASQPNVSNHLACLRWCGFVEARREHRTVYNRIADRRVVRMIELARELLAGNEEHVAACRRTAG
jgi:ArsR family transcriptional regulator, cadmium/lead-responsive transcriptional repressor